MRLRYRLYQLLDHRHPSLSSRLVDFSIMALITFNVIAVILESVPVIYATYRDWFDRFEFVSVLAFSIEYFVRV
ncbi:MAG TPA: ion transporter, partial [Methylothermaceae bacterium]|nr:ion transporter [Methylothermaceae bacterium]